MGVLMNQQDIFNGTVWENITLGNESISIETINEVAEKVGLTDFIATLKNGYDTILDPTGNRLPRNVILKILLVRALAATSRVLLLEEPWQNIENGQRNQIIQLLSEIKNTTLIVISNDEDVAKLCNKVIMIEKGKIINQ